MHQARNDMKTVVILSLCALAFALGMFFDGLITRVPEESKVVTQMRVIERELKIYHRQHETLPPTLADLQRFSPCIERCLTNSWGRPICYDVTNSTEGRLTTVGFGNVEFVRRFTVKEN